MSEKTTKDKKERTLSLKPGLVSSTNTKNSRSPRVSTVVVESRRGRVSQTRKPVAPSVSVRKAPSAPNVFKPKKDDEKQIINYSNNLRSIISTPIISLLVYINDTIIVKNIVKSIAI